MVVLLTVLKRHKPNYPYKLVEMKFPVKQNIRFKIQKQLNYNI